ncbi:MAG: hypothetical protein ACLS5R_06160, partial [Blautia sp.]
LKNSGKNRWVVFLLAGLLLLVISIPNGEEQKLPAAQAEVADEKTLDQAETLAAGLERVLSRVHGVGKTKVLVTLKSDGKRLVEKDSSARNSSSKENSGNTDAEIHRKRTRYMKKMAPVRKFLMFPRSWSRKWQGFWWWQREEVIR